MSTRTYQLAALETLRGSLIDWQLAEVGMSERRPRFHALRDRATNGLAPRAVSAFNLFQTPTALALRMVQLAGIRPGAAVLEPSAGLGRLVSPALDAAQGVRLTAVDSSPACFAELRLSFPGVEVRQADFLAVRPAREGACSLIVKDLPEAFYDAVLMNPPFHLRADIKHIFHALKFLRPGGVLVAICMAGPARESALRPLCDLWEPLPAGTFRAEGADVETILFTIQN